MHDMLVKLYELENYYSPQDLAIPDVIIRKPIGPEKHLITEWVGKKFHDPWASEVDMALNNRPVTCFVAVKNFAFVNYEPIGFACYNATACGFFGPMGVSNQHQEKGVGRALLITTLLDMRNSGFGYAIIGGVGPAEYYQKAVGAVDIPGSDPSIWATWMK